MHNRRNFSHKLMYSCTVKHFRSYIILLVAGTLLIGWQSSGPISTGPNTYMISKSSAAGAFSNPEALKREVIEEANAFARRRGKVAVRVSSDDVRPAHGFPSYEYNFRLEDAH